jgi:hypothetical protein
MVKIKYIFSALVLIGSIMLILTINNHLECRITDLESIDIAKEFYKKININYLLEPFTLKRGMSGLILFGLDSKLVVVDNKYNMLTEISCRNKEVIHFSNEKLLRSIRDKYTSKLNNTQIVNWPVFIDKNRAKEILLSFASRIGVPHDAEFSDLRLDANSGIWTAIWKKKYDGIVYEKDYLAMSIIAVSGEFYGYNKWLEGEPSSSEVKVSRADAIEIAYKNFVNYFPKDKWDKNKDKFELKSVKLEFVRDDGVLNKILSMNDKPRLAWVVIYDAKEGMARETVGILIVDKSIIKIDALNKKILSSKIEVVP